MSNDHMEKLFEFDGLSENKRAFHSISTDHPFMAEIGLSTFTTGTLFDWWYERDYNGHYKNRKLIGDVDYKTNSDPMPYPVYRGLEYEAYERPTSWGSFYGWRRITEGGAGKYVKQFFQGPWDYRQPEQNPAGGATNYVYSDLTVSSFLSQYFHHWDVGNDSSVGSKDIYLSDGTVVRDAYNAGLGFPTIDPVMAAVSMNDFVSEYSLAEINQSLWNKKNLARAAFVRDIKSSKTGDVIWSGLIPFNVNLADNIFCRKEEWVTFKLSLFDYDDNRASSRSLTLASIMLASPPKDATGRVYDRTEDGAWTEFPDGDPTKEVAGELDANFNEYTGLWEGGSPQLVAVISQAVTPAKRPTVDEIKTMSTHDGLDNPQDASKHIIWGSGAAIPLQMQNGNPAQWGPTYAAPNNCPDDNSKDRADRDKLTLKVYNNSPNTIYTNETVILNRIDGLWHVMPFPDAPEAQPAATIFEGKWAFDYFATSVTHYFRDADWTTVTPERAEQALHSTYYNGNALNGDTYTVDKIRPWGHRLGWGIDFHAPDGYYQFTSFDFMDSYVAGTRGVGDLGRSLSTTNPTMTPAGQFVAAETNEGGPFDGREGLKNGMFFGCVFPDGYKSVSYADYLAERSYDVRGHQPGVDDYLVHKFEYFYQHENTDLAINRGALPFNDDNVAIEGRNDVKDPDEIGGGIPVFPAGHEKAGQVQTMFSNTSMLLHHLPADIGTNASIDGVNGQPLKNIHYLSRLYSEYDNPADDDIGLNNTYEHAKKFFTQGLNFLYKADLGEKRANSAFDFEPVINNRVMFCPLKAEVYAAVGAKPATVFVDAFNRDNGRDEPEWLLGTSYEATRDMTMVGGYDPIDHRVHFGGQAARQMESSFRPVSQASQERELNFDAHSESMLPKGLIHDDFGLHFNASMPGWDGHQANQPLGFLNGHPAYIESRNARFRWDAWYPGWGSPELRWQHHMPESMMEPQDFWDAGTENWAENGVPAGAVGVIGAVATCVANTEINFSVDNKLGVYNTASYSKGPVGGSISMGIIGGMPMVLDLQTPGASYSKGIPGWGPGSRPQDFNTTTLHVTVYHSWPRDQTIYDSRYFAVHHFNPDIETQNYDHGLDNTTAPGIDAGGGGDHSAIVASGTEITHDGVVYEYWIDQEGSAIDYKIPTMHLGNKASPKNDADDKPTGEVNGYKWAAAGNKAFTDGFKTGDDNIYPALPESQWSSRSDRRGKLLPYTYHKRTVGIPSVAAVELTSEVEGYVSGGTFYALSETDQLSNDKVQMLVASRGAGYAQGDTFTTTAGDSVVITVDEIEVGTGSVSKFSVTNQGGNVPLSSFLSTGTIIKQGSQGGLFAVPLSTKEGSDGFSLSFNRGEVVDAVYTDPKPLLATSARYTRISTPPDTSGPTPGFQRRGYVQALQETTVAIENQSSDSRYDIFFHFHNDISHTFLTNEWQGSTQTALSTMQYVDATITMT